MKRVYQIGIALLLILSLVSGVAFAEGTNASFDFWGLFSLKNVAIASAVLWLARYLCVVAAANPSKSCPDDMVTRMSKLMQDAGNAIFWHFVWVAVFVIVADRLWSWVTWIPFLYLCITCPIGIFQYIGLVISAIKGYNQITPADKLLMPEVKDIFMTSLWMSGNTLLSLIHSVIMLLYLIKVMWL